MKQISVLLVEDHDIVRQGLRLILEKEPDIRVIGEAKTSDEAYQAVRQFHTDVVLMDIALPGVNGIETTRTIKQEMPDVHVIALTMHTEDEYIFAMLKAGAEGYLVKDSRPTDLVRAVRAVSQGEPMLCPSVTKRLINNITLGPPTASETNGLSEREKEILRLMATGATSKEIALELHLSAKTVDNHRTNVIEKLQARNKVEAIIYAMQQGLILAGA